MYLYGSKIDKTFLFAVPTKTTLSIGWVVYPSASAALPVSISFLGVSCAIISTHVNLSRWIMNVAGRTFGFEPSNRA